MTPLVAMVRLLIERYCCEGGCDLANVERILEGREKTVRNDAVLDLTAKAVLASIGDTTFACYDCGL